MKAPVSLSFQPVSCVLTSANAVAAEVQIFEINAENSKITVSVEDEECFVLVLGSVVLVGPLAHEPSGLDSVAIVELPSVRMRVTGEAIWRHVTAQKYEVSFEGTSDTGAFVKMCLYCTAIESDLSLEEISAAAAKAHSN